MIRPVILSSALALSSAVILSCGVAHAAKPVPAKVGFNKDIRPILAENCFPCHGPDPAARKAQLRLDTQAGFFDNRGDGATIIKGKPLDSPLFKRISSHDENEIMPPPKSHKQLKPEQIALIKQWIEEGAPWQPHWSFLKPERSALPAVKNKKWVKNPIDNFILARLEQAGLQPAPEADKYTLARRVSLDLTGLPPTPQELENFVGDKAPDAYEKLVDRLLASPHYGEHRGRYWLDAARYADTHGLHFDNYREIWPYRDWVINAINKNEPFDQFTVEQIAGDLLPNPTQDQRVATGFHRCNTTTNEGGTIVEENLANYARDRVETTSWVWLGLTSNCAACHDHKFDPITQKDFYSMSAFFRNTTQGGLDGNIKTGNGPIITVITDPDDSKRWDTLPELIKTAKAAIETRKKEAAPDYDKWVTNVKAEDFKVPTDKMLLHAALTEGAGDEIKATSNEAKQFKATGAVEWKADGKLGAAPVIKKDVTFDLGDIGDFEKDQSFSYGAWVKGTGIAGAGIIARMDEGSDFRGWDLWAQGNEYAAHIINKWPENALKVATEGNALKPNEWQHVFVTYDGSAKPAGLKIYVNGVAAKTRVEQDSLKDTIRSKVPLRIGQRSKGSFFENGQVQDVRLYNRKLEAGEVKSLADNSTLQSLIGIAADKRNDAQKKSLLDYYLNNEDATYKTNIAQVSTLETEKTVLQNKYPITHVQQEKMDSTPMANILYRGAYDQPKDKVEANVFSALNPMPKDAPKNRLGLAKWLVDAENPLTARVTVNRFWQEVFGNGIVKTSEDLGIMGEAPSHPELLDWLAVEFRESGWDMKHIFKLMVMSSAYRQASITTPQKREKDLENRLLSRGPRFRMDAEMIRDYALAASGTLSAKLGGPPAKPYNPDGLWDVVGMSGSDTRTYVRDKGEGLYRRSVYDFWKRMSPPANLEILNAPARETSCLRRERTNTPLQALVIMNDPQFVEASRNLAQTALKQGGNDDKTLDEISERLLCRTLKPAERQILKSSLQTLQAEFAAKPDDAKAFINVGESKPDDKLPAPQLAAWTMVSSQMLNLDEVLNK